MTRLERFDGDPPGVYWVTSTEWPAAPPRLEGAWIAYDGRLVGVVRRAYHYPATRTLVLIVHTFRAAPSIADLVDELIGPLRRDG